MIRTLKNKLSHLYHAIRTYGSDAGHYITHSLMSGYTKSEYAFLRMITLRAHVVEKGLTMPHMRANFGEENILALIALCKEYIKAKHDTGHTLFKEALSVLCEYQRVHESMGKSIPPLIATGIRELVNRCPSIEQHSQPEVRKSELFQHGDFAYVAHHRHSVRHFEGTIRHEDIIQAIDLARTAPSACNRQPVRVHLIPHGALFDRLLSLQHGNRGFGSDAEYLLVVTATEEGYTGFNERNAAYVDGGIFLMNLLYALQYYAIASCTLNCSFLPDEEKQVGEALQSEDVAIAIIAIGSCPETFKVARSERIPVSEIIVDHSAQS